MGQVMLDVAGYELTAEEKDILDHPAVGGVILFTRNFHDKAQLRELVKQMRVNARQELLIGVDHEGGRVQRFKHGFSLIPAMAEIYEQSDTNMLRAKEYAETFGWLMSAELLDCDIDLSFAPVLDLKGISEVIGDRSFHSDVDIVIELADAFIQGMHDAGMKATGKHFPGHGSVQEDSHIATPVDKREKQVIFEQDMQVFTQLNSRNKLDAVMPAHVIYAECDSLPAGFSHYWIKSILRKQLGFGGVIFSDDLSMQGAAQMGSYTERASLALAAGCDMLLICNQPQGAVEVIDNLPIAELNQSVSIERIRGMKSFQSHTLSHSRIADKHKKACLLLDRFYGS